MNEEKWSDEANPYCAGKLALLGYSPTSDYRFGLIQMHLAL